MEVDVAAGKCATCNEINIIFYWNDAYMRQQARPSSVQTMSCRLVGTIPLFKPVLKYCWLDIEEQTLEKF